MNYVVPHIGNIINIDNSIIKTRIIYRQMESLHSSRYFLIR